MGRLKTTLPLELFASAIDCFDGDAHSLKLCALVCQSWLHFSRSNLFRLLRIDISNPKSKSRIASLADGSAIHCPYVQTLQLRIDEDSDDDPIPYETFCQILQNLPHLCTLSLDEDTVCNTKAGNPTPSSHTLEKLVMWFNDFSPMSISHMYVPLTQFSSVDHLAIESDEDSNLDPEIADSKFARFQPIGHLKIKSLSVFTSSACLPSLRKFLRPTLITLTALHIHYCPPENHRILGMLIRDAAPNLRELTLDVTHSLKNKRPLPPSYLTEAYWAGILNLSQCHALETITLVVEHCNSPSDSERSFAEVIEMFCCILRCIPPTIQKLVFQTVNYLAGGWCTSDSSKFPVDFVRMETTISKFTKLEVVAFNFILGRILGTSLDQLEAFITGRLPKLRHLLQFNEVKIYDHHYTFRY